MPAPRSGITPSVRWKVFARDGFRCRYCGAAGGTAVLVVDHIHPVSRGGRDNLDNLITACETCNQGKADSTTPTFGELDLYHDAASMVATWLFFDWIKLVETDHPTKVPSDLTLMGVARYSISYEEALEVLRTVGDRYNAGLFGEWPGQDEQYLTVEMALVEYAKWLGQRFEWQHPEGEERYKARFWEDVPY